MKWLPWRERKNGRDRELDEENQADFALEIQQRLEAGATREEAEFAARRDFGNVTRVNEVTRDMWGWSSLERLLQDTRYAVRRLRNAPAFTITAVLTGHWHDHFDFYFGLCRFAEVAGGSKPQRVVPAGKGSALLL